MSSAMIRFAVMINGQTLKAWQREAIDQLLNSGLTTCVLVISNPGDDKPVKSRFRRIFQPGWFYHFLLKRIFRIAAETEVSRLPAHVPIMSMKAIKKGAVHFFQPKQIEQIKALHADFILRFGYNILRGDILNCARFGVWSYHHGDERKFRGGPFGFWEIMRKEPSTGVILQKLTEKLDAGHVLLRRSYITSFHSYREMRQRLLIENTDMPLLALKKYILQNEPIPEASQTNAPVYKIPSAPWTFAFIMSLFFRRLSFHFYRLFRFEYWHIAFGKLDSNPFAPDLSAVKHVHPSSRSEFYADPFPMIVDGLPVILFEHFSYRKQIGHIASADEKKIVRPWKLKGNHMAYPFIFRYKDRFFIIPEQAESGHCQAFIANLDLQVQREVTLCDFPLVDPSMIEFEGRFYLFAGLKDQLPNEKLFVFWSDQPEGPFKPHHLNPVKVDPHGSRPGGSFFKHENSWYRPAQVFDKFYGRKIQINKILSLSPHQFDESHHSDIDPSHFGGQYHGLHTYSMCEGYFAVDLKQHKIGFTAFRFRWNQSRRKTVSND